MKYPKAPITEAVLDIRVATREGLDVEAFRPLLAAVGERFPVCEDQIEISGEMEIGSTASQKLSTQTKKIGLQFKGGSEAKLFQAQLGGFSFNKLPPYETWDLFRSEAKELWLRYFEIAKPKAITRVALRYINRLDLPLPVKDFKKYILTMPEIAPGLPQTLSNFLMQLHIPHPDIQAILVLNVARTPPVKDGFVSIVLDLDIFRPQNVPQTEKDLWDYFELLRDAKNNVFEACITDAMREMFH